MEKSFKEQHLFYMEHFYKSACLDFLACDAHDDRRVYINIYNQIIKALNSLPKKVNNYVACAMIEAMKRDEAVLVDIGRRFGRTDYIFQRKETE